MEICVIFFYSTIPARGGGNSKRELELLLRSRNAMIEQACSCYIFPDGDSRRHVLFACVESLALLDFSHIVVWATL